jgi:hypothetical protein
MSTKSKFAWDGGILINIFLALVLAGEISFMWGRIVDITIFYDVNSFWWEFAKILFIVIGIATMIVNVSLTHRVIKGDLEMSTMGSFISASQAFFWLVATIPLMNIGLILDVDPASCAFSCYMDMVPYFGKAPSLTIGFMLIAMLWGNYTQKDLRANWEIPSILTALVLILIPIAAVVLPIPAFLVIGIPAAILGAIIAFIRLAFTDGVTFFAIAVLVVLPLLGLLFGGRGSTVTKAGGEIIGIIFFRKK